MTLLFFFFGFPSTNSEQTIHYATFSRGQDFRHSKVQRMFGSGLAHLGYTDHGQLQNLNTPLGTVMKHEENLCFIDFCTWLSVADNQFLQPLGSSFKRWKEPNHNIHWIPTHHLKLWMFTYMPLEVVGEGGSPLIWVSPTASSDEF